MIAMDMMDTITWTGELITVLADPDVYYSFI